MPPLRRDRIMVGLTIGFWASIASAAFIGAPAAIILAIGCVAAGAYLGKEPTHDDQDRREGGRAAGDA